jgi:large subunit ribosomal protein L6
LKFVDLPQTQVRGRSKEIPKTAIEVKGPLGKRRCFILEPRKRNLTYDLFIGELTLNIPPFVEVTHDEALRKASLAVQDPSEAHQRAMWGM